MSKWNWISLYVCRTYKYFTNLVGMSTIRVRINERKHHIMTTKAKIQQKRSTQEYTLTRAAMFMVLTLLPHWFDNLKGSIIGGASFINFYIILKSTIMNTNDNSKSCHVRRNPLKTNILMLRLVHYYFSYSIYIVELTSYTNVFGISLLNLWLHPCEYMTIITCSERHNSHIAQYS